MDPKCFLDSKFFWTQQFLTQNGLATKYFLTKNILWPKIYFGPISSLLTQIFWTQDFYKPKLFWTKMFLDKPNFFDHTFVGPKIILDQNCEQKFLGPFWDFLLDPNRVWECSFTLALAQLVDPFICGSQFCDLLIC